MGEQNKNLEGTNRKIHLCSPKKSGYGKVKLPTHRSMTNRVQNSGKINLHCLTHPLWDILFQKLLETNTT